MIICSCENHKMSVALAPYSIHIRLQIHDAISIIKLPFIFQSIWDPLLSERPHHIQGAFFCYSSHRYMAIIVFILLQKQKVIEDSFYFPSGWVYCVVRFSFHWAKVIFGSHNFPSLLHHTVFDLFDALNGAQERKPTNANW